MAVDDSGHVAVHFSRDNFSRTPLLFKVPRSAWGIDTHSSKRLLAISCNAHIVTLFHLGMGIDGWEWTRKTPAEIELKGNQNNIPCVAFDRSGEYLANGSLDKTINLWRCRTGELIRKIAAKKKYWLQ